LVQVQDNQLQQLVVNNSNWGSVPKDRFQPKTTKLIT